jgi:polyhydroxybutyrate depolymerase
MKFKFIISLFFYLNTLYAGITLNNSFTYGGLSRSYRIYIPDTYNANGPNVPLILNLHGYTQTATLQQDYSNFMPIADTAGFLMVLPQGTNDNQGQPFWNAFLNPLLVDDLGFISALIDTIKANYRIDSDRVYATGLSNGGFMSHVLACKLSNKIAAIASVAGTFYSAQYPYNPNRAIPVMHVHGTADPTVPYYGGNGMISVDTTIAFWVRENKCNTSPVYNAIPNINTLDGSSADHYVYKNGLNGTSVELYKINSGAHTWPGSPYTVGTTNQDINASKEMWRFFRQYTLTNTTSLVKTKNTEDCFYIYKKKIYFKNVENRFIIINNLNGQECFKTNSEERYINLETLPNGLYTIKIFAEDNQKFYRLNKISISE